MTDKRTWAFLLGWAVSLPIGWLIYPYVPALLLPILMVAMGIGAVCGYNQYEYHASKKLMWKQINEILEREGADR